MGAKFEKGQTVWGAALWLNEVTTECAVVASCGAKLVRLEGTRPSEAFGFRTNIPVEEVYGSELEALQALAVKAEAERNAKAKALRRAENDLKSVAAAIARLAGATP